MNKEELHIMFVDDEQDNLDQMKIIMKAYPEIQFYLHLTQSGALRMLHRLSYMVDAIIIDLSLEDGSGRELTELIRKRELNYGHKEKVKIFWFTGWDVDLSDDYDPVAQTFYACNVRKLYKKGNTDAIQMIREVVEAVEGHPRANTA